MKTFWMFALAVAVIALFAFPTYAQPVISAKSGTISAAEGKVFLGNDPVEVTATKFPDIKENTVLRTELGRAEILLTPGVVMHVGENSSFRMLTKRLIDTRLELLTGSAVVSAVEIPKDTNITIVCKSANIAIARAGHYRIDADPGQVKTFAGLADVQLGDRHVEVSSGKMLTFGGNLASAEKFNKEDTDSLDNWAQRRDQMMAMANVSAARSASGYGGYGYGGYGYGGYGAYGPYGGYGGYPGYGMIGAGMWGYNPYFGMYTYIPGSGRFCDPYYGYCYWSPSSVYQVYYHPQPSVYNAGGGGFGASYPSMGATSGGYSGAMAASSSSMGASAAAAGGSASSAASSAGASSAGHGSAGSAGGGGGGRGH